MIDDESLLDEEGDEQKRFTFSPRLHIQRHEFAYNLINEFKCKSLLDIGCADGRLIRLIKNSIENFNLIVGIDLDEQALDTAKSFLNSSLFDLIHKRSCPLELYLLKGDFTRADDYFLEKLSHKSSELDLVSLVEVIEHMHQETLHKTIQIVFARLKPRLVLLTTPNYEFNRVFNESEYDEHLGKRKFRHWDHKFEWTRQEFQSWCQTQILDRYKNYELFNGSYTGVGDAPEHLKHVGFGTQIALFIRNDLNNFTSKSKCEFIAFMQQKQELNARNHLNLISSCQNAISEQANTNKSEVDFYLNKAFLSELQIVEQISYPFDVYNVENKQLREQLLLNEIDYALKSICKNINEGYYYAGDCELNYLKLEDYLHEKFFAQLPVDEANFRFIRLDELLDHSTIKNKFKIENKNQIVDLIKLNENALLLYEENDCYIAYKNEPSLKHEFYSIYRHENDGDDDYDMSANDSNNFEQGSAEAKEKQEDEKEEECWDNEIEQKPLLPAPKPNNELDQFEDAPEQYDKQNYFKLRFNNELFSCENANGSGNNSKQKNNILSVTHLPGMNYYAGNGIEFAAQLRSKFRQKRRELSEQGGSKIDDSFSQFQDVEN